MHCLVVDLDSRLAAGETLPTLPPWHVQENKWRAARYGLDAIVITDAASHERLVTDDLADLVERLAPVADRLGCAKELATVADIPRRGASYQRQRAVAEATGGDLVAVVELDCGSASCAPSSAERGSVAALGRDHLEPDAEQPDRALTLARVEALEQRHRGLLEHRRVVGRRRQREAAVDGDERGAAAPARVVGAAASVDSSWSRPVIISRSTTTERSCARIASAASTSERSTRPVASATISSAGRAATLIRLAASSSATTSVASARSKASRGWTWAPAVGGPPARQAVSARRPRECWRRPGGAQ